MIIANLRGVIITNLRGVDWITHVFSDIGSHAGSVIPSLTMLVS